MIPLITNWTRCNKQQRHEAYQDHHENANHDTPPVLSSFMTSSYSRIGLSITLGGRPESGERRGTCAHHHRPADPTDPGNAADLGTPQGLETRDVLLNARAMTVQPCSGDYPRMRNAPLIGSAGRHELRYRPYALWLRRGAREIAPGADVVKSTSRILEGLMARRGLVEPPKGVGCERAIARARASCLLGRVA
jgi:hypothetical protein